MKAELAANPREYGAEVQRVVADVDRDHRCRPTQMLFVIGKCLAREQMHGDGVARKRIQNQNVKLLEIPTAGLALEREPRIAKDNLHSAGRILQEGEVRMFAAGEFIDVGVDFIKAVNVAGLRQSSQRAHSHADKAYAHGMLRPIANHDACSAAWAVIARCETSALGVLILEPMNGIPVPQCEIILFVYAQNRQDTIKISRRSDDVVERGPLRNHQASCEQCQGDSRGATDEESRRSNLRRAAL